MTRQRVDTRLPALAEDLGDDPLAFEIGRRVAHDLERDLVAGPGPLGPGIADRDRLVEGRAVDLDEAGVAGLEVGPDEDARGPRQDLDDPAFGVHPVAPRPPGDLDGDLVAAGGVARGLGRDVDLVDLAADV